jgi:hypothetical protein
MRGVMTRGDKDAMRKHTDVFYVTGSVAWTVRSPYWNVALATDDEGNRILSDDVLDKVLPFSLRLCRPESSHHACHSQIVGFVWGQ